MLKRSLYLLLAILITLSPFAPIIEVQAAEGGSGTTYYVSTLTGNNNNDGQSKNKAFYNLQKINDIDLQPGDHVLLEAGSVFTDGFLHIQGSGAEDAPIVIDRYGEGENPEIQTNGQGVWYQDYGTVLDNPNHKNKGYVSSSILLYDVEYIEINNLSISNDPDMYGEKYSDLNKMNRTGVAAVAQNKGTIDHIYLNNLNIHDIRGNVYDKHMNNGGIYFTVFKPEDEAKTGISRYNDIIIENSVVNDVSRWGIAVGYTAYWAHFAQMAEIPDETIAKYGSSNVIIRNNYVKDPGGDAITAMYLDRPLIEYNVSDGAAKEINPEIYSETSAQRVAAGIWPWKSKDAVFQYNEAFDTHHNQDGQAWDADSGDGTVYQYNYSHNNGGGAVMICAGEAINTVFRYNISENDLSGVLNIPANPKAHIYNNTFYIKEGVDFIRDGMTGGTAVIENNIIYNAGEEKAENWTKDSNVTYGNNIYYNYTNTPESDEFAITDDPQLVDPGTGPIAIKGNADGEALEITHDRDDFNGYQLMDSSPAINQGKYIADHGGRDFFGNEVTGTPDIGAFESAAVSLEIYSDVYTIDGTDIKGVEKATTVEAFMKAITYDKKLSVEVFDADGNPMDQADIVTTGFTFKFSNDASTRTYTVVASDHAELLDAIYIVDEESQTVFVPILESNPTDVDEIKNGVTVHSTAYVKVFDGENEVTSGNIADGMQLKVIAENGEENVYTITTKNTYQYALDFVNGQQGNVWYAQKKVAGEYSNLTSFSTQYPTWDGKNYAVVGLQGDINDPVTEQTHGLLSDTMAKGGTSNEQGHAMAYRVPKSGTIQLSFKDDEPFLRQAPNAGGDVSLSFTLNGELIGVSYTLPNDGTPAKVKQMEIDVDQGDYLRIEIVNEGSPTKPSAYITPQIAYQEIEVSELSIAPIESVTAIEKVALDPVTVDVNDANATVTVDGLPVGLAYNPETRVIEGTPSVADWNEAEEVREFTVTIMAEEGLRTAELTFTLLIQRETDFSSAAMIQLIEEFEAAGEFANATVARSLKVHLTAVNLYEEQAAAKKVVKHMEGFKLLLDSYKKDELISENAYTTLMDRTDALIKSSQ